MKVKFLLTLITLFFITHTYAFNRCVDHIDMLVEQDHLNLNSCYLKEVNDIAFIVNYLERHSNIKSLDIHKNLIDSKGAQELAKSTTLKKIDVSWNMISDNGVIAFANNTSIDTIDI